MSQTNGDDNAINQTFYQKSAHVIRKYQQHELGLSILLSPNHSSFSQIPNLHQYVYVNLTRCHINDLDGVCQLKSTLYLYLDDNCIQNIDQLSTNNSIKLLSVQLNPIQTIDNFKSDVVEHLNLNCTEIHQIPDLAVNLPNLRSLTVQHCCDIQFANQLSKNLFHLDVSDTDFVDFQKVNTIFPNLINLDVNFDDDVPYKLQYIANNKVFKNIETVNEDNLNQTIEQIKQNPIEINAVLQQFFTNKYNDFIKLLGRLNEQMDELIQIKYYIKNDITDFDKQYSKENYQNQQEINIKNNLLQNYDNIKEYIQLYQQFFNTLLQKAINEYMIALHADTTYLNDLNINIFSSCVLNEQFSNESVFRKCLDEKIHKYYFQFNNKLDFDILQSLHKNYKQLQTHFSINTKTFDQYKKQLFEEIEIQPDTKRVEYETQVFQNHFNKYTTFSYYVLDQNIQNIIQVLNNCMLYQIIDKQYVQDCEQFKDSLNNETFDFQVVIILFNFSIFNKSQSNRVTKYLPIIIVQNDTWILNSESVTQTIQQFNHELQQNILIFQQYRNQFQYNTNNAKLNYECNSIQYYNNSNLQNNESINIKAKGLDISFNDKMQQYQLNNQDLIYLNISNCVLLEKLTIENVRLVYLDISFTKINIDQFVPQLNQTTKQSLLHLNAFGLNFHLTFLLNQLKQLQIINNKKITRFSQDITIQQQPFYGVWLFNQIEQEDDKLIDQYLNNPTEIQPTTQQQNQSYSNLVNSNNQIISLSLQQIKQQKFNQLFLANCSNFQVNNLKLLSVKSLNISNINVNIDDIFSDSCTDLKNILNQLTYLNISYNQTDNKYNLTCIQNVKQFFIDNVANLKSEHLLCNLQKIQNNQLTQLSVINKNIQNQQDIELLKLLKNQQQSLSHLNTFNTTQNYDIANYFNKLQYYNNKHYHQSIRTQQIAQFTQIISNNVIQQLGEFDNHLTKLTINYALIQQLIFDQNLNINLENIQILDLQNNNISKCQINTQQLKHLKQINLSYNLITEIFNESMTNSSNQIEKLVIAYNPIQILKQISKSSTSVNTPNLYQLRSLDLSGTKQCKSLQAQTFGFLGNLTVLTLNDCQFINISNDALIGLNNLIELHLINSSLRDLNILDGIRQYKSLKKLSLQNNKITTLNNVLKGLYLFKLTELNIENNPFCRSNYKDALLEDQLESIDILNNVKVEEVEKQRIKLLIYGREIEKQKKMGVTCVGFGTQK